MKNDTYLRALGQALLEEITERRVKEIERTGLAPMEWPMTQYELHALRLTCITGGLIAFENGITHGASVYGAPIRVTGESLALRFGTPE